MQPISPISRGLFIDGDWLLPEGHDRLTINDPATGGIVGDTVLADSRDVDRAVDAAIRAAPDWAATHADERAAILHKSADLIEARVASIATALTAEQGKPVPDAEKEIRFGIEVLRYYAEEGRRIGGSLRPSSRADIRSMVVSAPVGVVGAIVPWNYPVDLYCWKVAPALAAGCPIVVKPPHETPLAIGQVVSCLAEAGIPPGVLADLPGTGPEVGSALARHLDIRMISATASVAAGQSIMAEAAPTLKRLSLELGGQCPFLVLDDADIEEAAQAAMRRSFSNMGQICIAVNRILVARPVHRRFVEAMADLTGSIQLGHGLDPGVAYGPVLNDGVRQRTQHHVRDAVDKGAHLVIGGSVAAGAGLEDGYFFQPTIVDEAPVDCLPMVEETYGPLAAIHPVDDLGEMLMKANALPFGLAAYVFGRDLDRAWQVAERLEAGAVGVNINDTTELQAPFGGWKLSGMGRELGPEGLAAYRETKHIKLRLRNPL